MKNYWILLITIISHISCVQDDEFSIPEITCDDPNLVGSKSVEDMMKVSASTASRYEEDDVIVGYVISSDEGGNIYKNVSLVDDNGKGFNISLDRYDNYTSYEPGRKVYVKLKDLYTQVDFGALEIGDLYNNTQIGRIPEVIISDHLLRSCDVVEEETLVNKISISDISDQYLHTLLEFENVQFKDNEVGGNYYSSSKDLGGATNRIIVDELGYEVIVRTSSYSDFANNPLPNGKGKIRGVLTRFNSDYQLFMRTENDISMDEERTSINRLGIDALKSRSEGSIEDNYYIEGVVTLAPKGGNITERNIVLQDETGGIVVRFDNSVENKIEEGNKLKILIKDSKLGSFADVKQISDLSFNGSIDGENIVEIVEENSTLPTPLKLTLTELKNGNYESILVEVDDIQFKTEDVDQVISGSRVVTDCSIKFTVYTRSLASFGNQKIPNGSGKIVGIASSYYAEKQIILRGTDWFSNLSGNRCKEPEPLFYENFESISNTGYDVYVNLTDWYNLNQTGGEEKWEAREYSSNKYAQISAYNTAETSMVAWLITPEIDLNGSNNEVLTFDTKDAYNNGDALEVFISNDFNGNNVGSATWDKLDVQIAKGSNSSYASSFTSSGEIDISSYSGKVRIGFKYSGADPSKTTTYQVDEIKVLGN